MRKIGPKLKKHFPKRQKITVQKEIRQVNIQKPSTLERTPIKEIFDYSTEENGYFLRRDTNGNVLEVIRTIFPR